MKLLMRLALAALMAAAAWPAAAQTPADTTDTSSETRPATSTFLGDTGLWFVPTAEVLPDRRWSGALGGMLAYCRSKLGNHWIASELARRVPALEVAVVHPGVVATGLAGELGAFAGWLRRRILLTPEQGAQLPLFCATQPGLGSGGYWHNAHGRVRLAPADPARDAAAAARLWETCEALAAR